MKMVMRNEIRELLYRGLTELQIANKQKLSVRQIKAYVREIRLEDHQSLLDRDETCRASAMEQARNIFNMLKVQMLDIVLDSKADRSERIAAADSVRTFEMDLVNLSLNGYLAIRPHARRVLARSEMDQDIPRPQLEDGGNDGGNSTTESGPDT